MRSSSPPSAQHRANVERAGLPFAPTADPPAGRVDAPHGAVREAEHRRGQRRDAGAVLRAASTSAPRWPAQRAIVEALGPGPHHPRDLGVHGRARRPSCTESRSRGSASGSQASEELAIGLAAASVDEARAQLGLAPDPAGDRLRETPYLTMVPEALEHPRLAARVEALRFAEPATAAGRRRCRTGGRATTTRSSISRSAPSRPPRTCPTSPRSTARRSTSSRRCPSASS